jgi:hypothetical protein
MIWLRMIFDPPSGPPGEGLLERLWLPGRVPDQGTGAEERLIQERTRRAVVLNDRDNILNALRVKALTVREIMKRANVANEEVCQSLLLKMRNEGAVKFDIHSGRWLIG